MKKAVQIFLTLTTIVILLSNAEGNVSCPELPTDEQIQEAAREFYNNLKERGYPIEEYRAIKAFYYIDQNRVLNVVLFFAIWEEGSWAEESFGNGPYAVLVGEYRQNKLHWFFSEDVEIPRYWMAGWQIPFECEDGAPEETEDGLPTDGGEGFPLGIITAITVLIAVMAGVGVLLLSKGKKAPTMKRNQIYTPPPPPPTPPPTAPATAVPQVQPSQMPYSQIDPAVRRWLEKNPIYPGYWYVTQDGKYVTNEINPDYTIPVEWIKGTSSEPLAELFSTPVPEMAQSLHSSRITALIKRNNPELLDKLTLNSWRELSEDQRRDLLQKFANTLAEQLKTPSINVELDPNLEYSAVYDWNSDPPRIQISSRSMNCPSYSIGLVTHEFQHYIQHTATEKLPGATLEYLNAMKKNLENYIHHSVDPVRYAGQLWERDAESIAKIMSNKISEAAYRQKFERLVETIWGKEGLEILNKQYKAEAERKLERLFDKIFGKEGADILPKQPPSKTGSGR